MNQPPDVFNMEEFCNAHCDGMWVQDEGDAWDARCRSQCLCEKHPTDAEARDFASGDGSKRAHLSQDFTRIACCMINRMQPALGRLRDARFTT